MPRTEIEQAVTAFAAVPLLAPFLACPPGAMPTTTIPR